MLSNIQMHSDVCVCLCPNVCVCVCVVGSYIWYSKSHWPQKDLYVLTLQSESPRTNHMQGCAVYLIHSPCGGYNFDAVKRAAVNSNRSHVRMYRLYNEDEGLSNIHDRGRSPRSCIR